MSPHAAHLIRTVRQSLLGDDAVAFGPFGERRLVYADYAASGRALSFIEDYVRDEVLPFYANTHTEATATGRQTTSLREEARQVIHESVGASSEDCVLFCGSGATGAIDKLISVLGLRVPSALEARYRVTEAIPAAERPVVFIGPHEHHSNELPWRESIATVVAVPEAKGGGIDLEWLARALVAHAERPLKIGSFSAGSNVTGALADTERVTALLHRHGALSFWDYAAAGPYLPIEMNPERPGIAARLLQKDAVFLSPHKLVGGPGASGVLVAKRKLFMNSVPSVPGGGTISYVNAGLHLYTPDVTAREEGGTPDILGSIRAGLAFQLKQAVGCEAITERDESFTRRAIAAFRAHPEIVVLGDPEAPRLPIVSFLVRHEDRFLHHQFVVALLSDLFGIQARGGCSCAGPYGHALLGIEPEAGRGFAEQVLRGRLGIKPGWTRITFGYFFSEAVFEYVVEAVRLIASFGYRLLPEYEFDPETGEWSHRSRPSHRAARLSDIDYARGRMQHRTQRATAPESALASQLEQARALLSCRADGEVGASDDPLPEDFERLRWFTLPAEVARMRDGRELESLPEQPIRGQARSVMPETFEAC